MTSEERTIGVMADNAGNHAIGVLKIQSNTAAALLCMVPPSIADSISSN